MKIRFHGEISLARTDVVPELQLPIDCCKSELHGFTCMRNFLNEYIGKGFGDL